MPMNGRHHGASTEIGKISATMVHLERAASIMDLLQILDLQQRNLPHAISAEERRKEGFVTVSHTLDTLKAMNDTCSHIVAKSDNVVIGYALCMHPKFAGTVEVLRPMFAEIDAIRPKIESYIVMGQICVDKRYRGQGIFRQLYQTMKYAVESEFDYIITEVDAMNLRSLQAHYHVGFTDLKTYLSGGQEWKLISLAVSSVGGKSV